MYVNENDDAWTSINDANKMLQDQWGYSLTFNKDGTLLASSAGEHIKIWKFNNGVLSYEKTKYMIKAHKLDINILKFSKCSNLLLSGSDDQTLCIWQGDVNNSFSKLQQIQLNSWPIHAIFNNDDSFIFVGCWNGNLLIFGKIGNQYNNHQTIVNHQQQIYSVSLNHSETLLLTLGWDNRIFIYNKDVNSRWNQKQEIILNNQGFRASFIDDNQIVYQPKSVETIELYQFDGFGNFEKKNVMFQVKKAEDDKSYFPIKYNKQLGLVAIKYNQYINVYKKKSDNAFELKSSQKLDNDTFFGDISPDFQYAVVWIKSSNQYQIKKL